MNKFLFVFFGLFITSCNTSEKPDVELYVKNEVELRLKQKINEELYLCQIEAKQRANILVDSLYKVNPIKFLSDSSALPEKPIKPDFPEIN